MTWIRTAPDEMVCLETGVRVRVVCRTNLREEVRWYVEVRPPLGWASIITEGFEARYEAVEYLDKLLVKCVASRQTLALSDPIE